ncbi:ATP-binding protein [Ideonella sp. YS5]|uniref:sensor histidine kinase n=1 Tax=Ideonella sp. YS5 TaxID=3453714 RepID=UPI003F72C8EC
MLCSGLGEILRINRTMCRWLERRAEELVGRRKVQHLLSIGGQIFFQTHLAPLLHIQGSVSEVKLDVVKGDGGTVPMVLNAIARGHGPASTWELAFFVAQDRHQYELELLKARQRAESLLEHERRALDDLAKARQELERQRGLAEDRAKVAELLVGVVSHDLRNPLNVIRTSAQILGVGEQAEIRRQALQRITSATGRAARMIADLLDLTQVRLGSGLVVRLAPIDLHEWVGEVVSDLRLAFPGRDIVHQREAGGACHGDGDRLTQLVGNLVANAVSYGARDSTVSVATRADASGGEISVHNLGDPIPPELLPSVFEPLQRGEQEGSHSIGLGLFIVQAIARAHGGQASVTSSAEDGTRFVVRWPAPTAPA